MSRIGRLPVAVPAGVQVDVKANTVSVKGPLGELKREFSPKLEIALDGGHISVKRNSDEAPIRALHGTTRAIIQNMVTGVSTGFSRVLTIEGVGYRAEMTGQNLTIYIGYSHPVVVEPPAGIKYDVDTKTRQIKVMGYDREQVGQVAANIRMIRPPEPYHGKGLRYSDEVVRRKPGKSGKGAKG